MKLEITQIVELITWLVTFNLPSTIAKAREWDLHFQILQNCVELWHPSQELCFHTRSFAAFIWLSIETNLS